MYSRLSCRLIFFILLSLLSFSVEARTFTLVNNCSAPVWFGFSGGSANGRLSGTQCNSNSDCYPGTACVQTGGIRQCFWINPQPANGNYQLSANGGTNQISIPDVSNPLGFVWSGVIAGRTNCSGGGCETADCGGGAGSCKPSQGFTQPATQAEFTLSYAGTDYYDVEVINGVNLPVSMVPSVGSTAGTPYQCGSAGAAQPSAGMGACNWQLTPPSIEYQWVTARGAACSANSNCGSGNVCGLSFNPGSAPLLKKSCGRLLGYWTANQICGIQRDYGAPFFCNQSIAGGLTMWNLMACVGVGSCYQPGAASNCCGCINWNTIGIPVPPGPTTEQCRNTNPTWNNSVQPTLSWLKRACPTVYTYPYDDMSSTFTCRTSGTINQVNYTITFCPSGSNNPPPPPPPDPNPPPVPPPGSGFSYNVTLGYPFSQVTINGNITCPSVNGNPTCLIQNQAIGSTMTIIGRSGHRCNLGIQSSGSVAVQGTSIGCFIDSRAATASQPGQISLPGNF